MEFRRKTKEEILEEKLIERYKDFYILEMMKLVENLAIQRAKEDVKRLLKGDEITYAMDTKYMDATTREILSKIIKGTKS
jgi:hypothetical protein